MFSCMYLPLDKRWNLFNFVLVMGFIGVCPYWSQMSSIWKFDTLIRLVSTVQIFINFFLRNQNWEYYYDSSTVYIKHFRAWLATRRDFRLNTVKKILQTEVLTNQVCTYLWIKVTHTCTYTCSHIMYVYNQT